MHPPWLCDKKARDFCQSVDSGCIMYIDGKFWMSPLLWHQTKKSINIFQSQPPLKLFLKTPVPSQQRSRSHDLTCTSMTNVFTAKTSNSSFFGSRGICFNDLTGTGIETRLASKIKKNMASCPISKGIKRTTQKRVSSPWLKKCVAFTENSTVSPQMGVIKSALR